MSSTQSIRAGRAFVELFADDSKLVRGLRRAERRIKAFGKHISSMGRRLTALGTAVAMPVALATRVFAGFDDQMRAVQAILGATGEQFDLLNAKAKKLGRTTSYTAAQVAGAMLELGRAGFAALQIDASIASVLALARATGTELPAAANIAAGTLRAFSLEADQMGRVADVMTATANNSAQTLEDLGEAMKYAAPVADAYGLSLAETTKILGALANFSIRGSMAGNTLKNIMLQLADRNVRARLTQLGVATTDTAGNMLEVSEVLRELGNAIVSMPKADRLSIMNELFGRRAVAGGIKLTAASFDRLNEAIDHAGGTAQRTAETMDSGIGGALRRLWSAAEGVAIGIGESLAGAISDMADWLGRVARMITAWIESNRELIVTVVKVIAAAAATGVGLMALGAIISALGSGLGVLVTVVTGVAGAFKLLIGVLGFLVSPIGLVISAVAALGSYLVYASGAGGKALTWLGNKFNTLKEDALAAYEGIADALAAGDIGLAVKILWLTLKMEWTRGIGFLEKAWLKFRNSFIRIGYDAWGGLLAVVEVAWHGLEVGWIETVAFLGKTWTNFTSFFAKSWERMKAWAQKAWHWIKGLFDESARESQEQVYAAIDRQKEAAIQRIEGDQQRQLARRDAERQRKREQAAQLHEATLAEIGTANLRQHQQLDAEYERRMADNEADLERARQEWREAIEQARKNRQAKETEAGPEGLEGPDDIIAKANRALSGLGDLLADQAAKIGAQGTFVAGNVLGLQAGGVTDRMASGIDKIERNTRPLRNAEGLSFT